MGKVCLRSLALAFRGQARLPNLINQRPVADVQRQRRLSAVPFVFTQRIEYQVPFHLADRLLGNSLERDSAVKSHSEWSSGARPRQPLRLSSIERTKNRVPRNHILQFANVSSPFPAR